MREIEGNYLNKGYPQLKTFNKIDYGIIQGMDYEIPIQAKSLSINIERFTVAEQEEYEYEHWVNLTSKLIKRPYFATHKMVEKWPIDKIIRHYELSTKHAGNIPQDVKWWYLRKINK